jgi:hypothetical protein
MKSYRLSKAGVIAGLTAGALAGAAFGVPAISLAQDATTTAPETTEPAADIQPEHQSHMLEALQPLIDDGTLTQAQADAVIAALEAARPLGPGPHGGPRGGPGLDAAAEALGLSTDELHAALEGGSSIADVAAAHGVDVQTVIDAMQADLQAHLAERVASGELTQEEADARLAEADARITDMVNGELPPRPERDGSSGES